MNEDLHNLLESTKNFVLTPEVKKQQRRSFVYGNVVIENPCITREMVDRAADALNARVRDKGILSFRRPAPPNKLGEVAIPGKAAYNTKANQ